MAEDSTHRSEELRRQAAQCLEAAKVAVTPKARADLIAMAAKFHELANSTAAHNFGAIMQEAAEEITREPPAQQQRRMMQCPPPKKDC